MNLIVAITKNYAIGKNNQLLFHLPTDLAYFKMQTTDKIVVMGERTYLSLPKKPLPKRINIVISDKLDFKAEGAIVVHSLEELLKKIKKYKSKDVFVCGGASIYNLLMDYCDTAYVTYIDKIVPADTFINNLEEHGFKLTEETPAQTENNITFTFRTYKNPHHKKI